MLDSLNRSLATFVVQTANTICTQAFECKGNLHKYALLLQIVKLKKLLYIA